jgi:hypothetical protein
MNPIQAAKRVATAINTAALVTETVWTGHGVHWVLGTALGAANTVDTVGNRILFGC